MSVAIAVGRRFAACLGLCLALMLPGHSTSAAPAKSATSSVQAKLDYQVKAAMLYKFLGYTDWPDSAFAAPESPYYICVLGARNVETELRGLVAGRTINGRSIEVTFANRIDQIGASHLVFVAHEQESSLPALALATERHPYLVVTENDTGLLPASAINLRLLDGRIGFDISLGNTQKAGLKLSSRLLTVAATVQEVARP